MCVQSDVEEIYRDGQFVGCGDVPDNVSGRQNTEENVEHAYQISINKHAVS